MNGASNFGLRGEAPTHPELLDYLAARFVESGWSIKALHRLIVSSRAYQRASSDDPANATVSENSAFVYPAVGALLVTPFSLLPEDRTPSQELEAILDRLKKGLMPAEYEKVHRVRAFQPSLARSASQASPAV